MKTWVQVFEMPKLTTDSEPRDYCLSFKATGNCIEIEELKKDIDFLFRSQDLPSQLRELAPQLKEIMGMIPAEEDGAIKMLDYMRALEAENLGYKFEEWAAELEKEE